MRQSEIIRKTAETDICLSLLLDGTGRSSVNTGVGFLDHMLTLFASMADLIWMWSARAILRWMTTIL